jgi:hypothetical protein
VKGSDWHDDEDSDEEGLGDDANTAQKNQLDDVQQDPQELRASS